MSDYNDRWKALQEKHPDLQKVLDDPAVKKAGEYYEMDQRLAAHRSRGIVE